MLFREISLPAFVKKKQKRKKKKKIFDKMQPIQ